MTIAVLGTGNVGRPLTRGWAAAGHAIVFGSRQPASSTSQDLVRQLGDCAAVALPADAALAADVVVLALPWSTTTQQLLASLARQPARQGARGLHEPALSVAGDGSREGLGQRPKFPLPEEIRPTLVKKCAILRTTCSFFDTQYAK